MITLTIILFLSILILIIKKRIKDSKERIAVELDILYDKMELYIAKNNITVDNDVISYLTGYKAFKVNPEYADIQVLLGLTLSTPPKKLEELKNNYSRILNTIPAELKEYGNEFNKKVGMLIGYSMINFKFIVFALVYFIKFAIISLIKLSFNEIKKASSKVKEAKANDLIIVGSANLC